MFARPPHHVSSLPFRISCLFRISSLGFRISPDLSGRIMRNEPNLHRGGPVEDQICKTNPIYPNQKCKTNPICRSAAIRLPKPPRIIRNEPNSPPVQHPNPQNEPNFTRAGPVENQKMQNEPNYTALSPKAPKRLATPKKSAKQSTASPKANHIKETETSSLGETNPILTNQNTTNGPKSLHSKELRENQPGQMLRNQTLRRRACLGRSRTGDSTVSHSAI